MADPRALDTLRIIRRLLLITLLAGLVGSGTELLLIGHTEEWTQVIPLILVGLAVLGIGLVVARPGRRVVQLFAGLMGLFLVAGVVGLVLHYLGNVEFELEMRPSIAGFELVSKALTGATPALAPGSMVLLGLIGLLYTYRHPALRTAGIDETSN